MSTILSQIAPYLGAAGNELQNWDDNLTGADDFTGALLIYVAEVNAAIEADEDIPELPDILRKGTNDKISGSVKLTVRIASSALTIAQFQVSGRAAKILKYVNQALRNLLAGREVPAAPAIV